MITTMNSLQQLRRASLSLALAFSLTACGGGGENNSGTSSVASSTLSVLVSSSSSVSLSSSAASVVASAKTSSSVATSTSKSSSSVSSAIQKSPKRGIAYNLATPEDITAISAGVSWWYNWSDRPNSNIPADYQTRYNMDYYPMLWNFNFNATDVENFLQQNPGIKYILVLNEPNLTDQSNKSPQDAATEWPKYEAIANHTGVKIVGPAITWGTQTNYEDPVKWLDAFYAAYRAANNNRDPHIDYLAFHWYDYGLAGQLDRLQKYGKEFWITEFANWHPQNDGAQIDTLAKQITQMTEMVSICESRSDVFRYAWFTGRWSNDVHFTSILAANGQLTDLGKKYISLPNK